MADKVVITKKRFSEEIQKVITEETGTKISKEAAWELYKAIYNKTVDLAIEGDVSLAGVGKFVVQRTKPRGEKVGKVEFVPRFKVRASSRINAYLEEKLGQVVPGTERKADAKPAADVADVPEDEKDDLDF